MSKKDRITGTWSANGNTGDLIISYSGQRVEGFYTYQSTAGKKARALIIEDSNKSGSYESSDIIFGGFSAKAEYVRSGKIPVVASGDFVADATTGRFKLFYEGTKGHLEKLPYAGRQAALNPRQHMSLTWSSHGGSVFFEVP